jgi:hypothetical protein
MMDTRQFLGSVLAPDGNYCVVGIKDQRTIQKFYSSIDAVLDAASNLDQEGYNAYFALGTFIEPSNRKADNVKGLKSLFLDIDCGPDKPYPTQLDAVKALLNFRRQYGIPNPSAVINSGGGLHVYWGLDRTYSRDEWLPAAHKLKEACLGFGVAIDPVVTADAARILRVPNTNNYKQSPPLQVRIAKGYEANYSLEDIVSKLPEVVSVPTNIGRAFNDQDRQDMEQAIGSKYVKKFSRMVRAIAAGGGCNQIRRALMQPQDLGYPEWLHVLSIAKMCEVDGDKAIHLVSKNYPNYDPEETEKVAQSIEYPHLCSTFEKDYPAGCEGCPHKKNPKFKSPIRLCMEVREAESNVVTIPVTKQEPIEEDVEEQKVLQIQNAQITYTIPEYPKPYFRESNGGVYMRTTDDKGNPHEKLIYKRDLYLTKRMYDPEAGPCYQFRHHTAREGVKEFVIPSVELSSPDSLRKAMGINDIFVLNKYAGELMGYIAAWIEELKNTEDEVELPLQFGWSDDHKSFLVGPKCVFADRIETNPPSSRTAQYMHMFSSKGTLEGWIKMANFYNRPNFEVHQHMIGLAFGSPLVEFLENIHGSIFHITSALSGFGKTTGQFAGASVWGDYSHLVLNGKDTGNSIWNRVEVMKNIPVYVEEMTNTSGGNASEFCYAVADGHQKNRMGDGGQNKERVRGKTWALSVGTSGNVDLVEAIGAHRSSPQGEAARVTRTGVKKLLLLIQEVEEANEMNKNMKNNYGHAGIVFIQHVIKNLEQVKKLLEKTRDRLLADTGYDVTLRFAVGQGATNFTSLMIAKEIGLINWDLEAYYKWLIMMIKRTKIQLQEMVVDIKDLIGRYYTENVRGILRLKSDGGAPEDPMMEQLIMPDAMPSFDWVGRHEYDISKIYLIKSKFKQWCIKQGLHFANIEELITQELKGRQYKMRLGRNTKLDITPQDVIEMSWDRDEYVHRQQENQGKVAIDDLDDAVAQQ